MQLGVTNLTELLSTAARSALAGRYDEAHAIADCVVQLATLHNQPAVAARARFARSEGAYMRGDFAGAIADAQDARRLFLSVGDSLSADLATTRELFLSVDQGDLVSATELAQRPLNRATVGGAIQQGYIGNLMRARGDWASAAAHYDGAVKSLAQASVANAEDGRGTLYATAFRMDRGITAALAGDLPTALRTLRRARSSLRALQGGHTHLDHLLSHYIRLTARILKAPLRDDEAFDPTNDQSSRNLVIAALERASCELASARTLSQRRNAARALCLQPETPWEHARLSAQLLRRFHSIPTEEIWLDFDGETLRLVRGSLQQVMSLGDRPSLARIVALLVQHSEIDNEGVNTQRLIAHAWPEEIILPSAARNRLYVAIATLRAMGLRDLIVRTNDGYALGTSVRLVC
ncbi:MAG: hypothetical protein IPK60_13750 [Sandaracinaceae bacterium]|nr:hypothetical protein [Sandaracinaceae bacterium]